MHLYHDSTGVLCSHIEKQLHINVIELKAVILALQHFSKQCSRKQVLVASDNPNVVAHINKQGGSTCLSLCPHVATPYMVQQTPDITQSKTCPEIT